MNQKRSNFAPIQVIWEDFCVSGGWHDANDIIEAQASGYLVKSVGYLVSWDKKRLVLVSGFTIDAEDHEHGYQEIVKIPRGMIKKITYLGATNVPQKAYRIIKQRNRNKR